MCFPDDHSNPTLRGQPKGIRAVLEEHKSIWDKFTTLHKQRSPQHSKLVGKCGSCTKSQLRKDAEHRIALADAMGQDDSVKEEDIKHIESEALPITNDKGWCCMYRVLALQEDFQTEKPLIQSVIKDAGHICLFLPQFHCELNVIEMLWGYAKFRVCVARCTVIHLIFCFPGYRDSADGKFNTAKALVPQCLDSCNVITIRKFFQKA